MRLICEYSNKPYTHAACTESDNPPDVAGLGTTATAVVLQGPKIRLYGRIITSEAAGGLMSVHGTMVSNPLQCVLFKIGAPD